MADYFGGITKRKAPQAKKFLSQMRVGPNTKMFDNTGAGQPMGGANMRTPTAGPYVKPEGEEQVPQAAPKKPFDWNRMSYVLGGIGQAAMGKYQDRWQAQLGGQVQKLSQAQAYQKATARALAGEKLDPNEYTILTPEQRQEVNALQTENEKLQLAREEAWFKREMAMRKQKMDEGTIAEAKKEFWAGHGQKVEEFEEKKKQVLLEREHDIEMQKLRNKGMMDRAKAQLSIRNTSYGGYSSQEMAQHEKVYDGILDEAWRRFEAEVPDEDDRESNMSVYYDIVTIMGAQAVKSGRLPPNWIVTQHGPIIVDPKGAAEERDLLEKELQDYNPKDLE